MYANEKQSWDDMKDPGDWMKTSHQSGTDEKQTPYGVSLICKCGDYILLAHRVHQIVTDNGVLDISPSIGHYNNDKTFKCHYFIKNGEYVQC